MTGVNLERDHSSDVKHRQSVQSENGAPVLLGHLDPKSCTELKMSRPDTAVSMAGGGGAAKAAQVFR